MDDKTKLSYWLGQTGGRTNAAYTLQKEYNHALQGRGPGPRTLKKDMVSTTSSTPSISTPTGYQYSPDTYVDTPRGYQYSPDTYKAPGVDQAFGMSHPAGARGLSDFQPAGSKIASGPKHAAFLIGGLAAPLAVPVAAAGAGFVAAAPAVAAALGTAGAIGTKIVSNVSKVGTRVSSVLPATKASKLAADTAAKKTADRLANAAARKKAAAAAKKKAAAADKAQKGETAAMTNYAGALGQQDARMGGSGARR